MLVAPRSNGKDVEMGMAEKAGHHCIEFSDITYTVNNGWLKSKLYGVKKGKIKILHGVSGKVSSGQVMAIIGPSGAGKTTLLNVISIQPKVTNDKSINVEGGVLVNGEPLTREIFANTCSYMTQEETLWPALSTWESVMFSAKLHGTDDPERKCANVLRELGLESVRDTKVGSIFIRGLSGGQKRRLSLACELMNETATFFFLDEPTSGLDAASASETMQLITRVAKQRNVAVIATLHQPSSQIFYALDQLMLLSRGRVAYCGSSENALAYFESKNRKMKVTMNPADFLLEIVNSDFRDLKSVDELLDAWQPKCAEEAVADFAVLDLTKANCKTSFFSRFIQISKRAWLCYKRDPAVYLFRLGLYAAMSIFLGLTYSHVTHDQKDLLDMFFAIIWNVAFFSFMAIIALPAFTLERDIITKEITNGYYSLGEYVLSASLMQIPVLLACGLIASIGPYWFLDNFAGMNPLFSRFVQYWLILSLHLYAIESFAVLTAVLVPNFMLGIIAFVSGITQFFVYNGFFIASANMPPYLIWEHYGSFYTYSNLALFRIVFDGLQLDGMQNCLLLTEYPCYGATGEDVLEALSHKDNSMSYVDTPLWMDIVALFSFSLLFRFCVWFFMRKSVR